MIVRLVLGLLFSGAVWSIAGLAASTGSIAIMCVAGCALTLATFWVQARPKVRKLFPEDAQSAFNVLGLVGAMAVVGQIADDRSRYWFAGSIILTALTSVVVVFFKREAQNERTR